MSVLDLSGKVALVTGGSRGIGAATAELFAAAGAWVAITYRSRKEDAELVVERCNVHGEVGRGRGTGNGKRGRAIALKGEVSSREDNERLVAETIEHFGKLDIFVANAGIWPPEEIPVSDMTDEHWRRTMRVNVDSVFFGCRAAIRAMQAGAAQGEAGSESPAARPTGTRWGRIVIVSSTAGQRGEGYHADYAASKGAVQAFVKSLCIEGAPYDITVNAVAPGWVDTEMCDVPFGQEGGSGKRVIEEGIPLGRVASPADIAGPIVFLCSDLARHVTGEIVNVNGGSVLCG